MVCNGKSPRKKPVNGLKMIKTPRKRMLRGAWIRKIKNLKHLTAFQNSKQADAGQRPPCRVFFFHPDFTVGPGISPGHASARKERPLAGCTAGRESHPALKNAGQHHTIASSMLCGSFTPGFCCDFLQYIKYCREIAPHLDVKSTHKSFLLNDAVLHLIYSVVGKRPCALPRSSIYLP